MFIENSNTIFADEPVGGQDELRQGFADHHYEIGFLRPMIMNDGKRWVRSNDKRWGKDKHGNWGRWLRVDDLERRGLHSPIWNATSLRKEDYIELDRIPLIETRKRLQFVADCNANGMSEQLANAMGVMTYEHEVMSDPGLAQVDMDIINDGRTDTPLFKLRSQPNPVTYASFQYGERRLQASRRSGRGLDMAGAEWATQRVLETIEKTAVGVVTGLTAGTVSAITGPGSVHDGTSTVYGLINYVNRNTKTNLTVPTGSNPDDTVTDVLEMCDTLALDNFFGPYILYHSPDWSRFMGNDYFQSGTGMGTATGTSITLQQRLEAIPQIDKVQRLDWLSSQTFTLILVEKDKKVFRMVNGIAPTMVQWESRGGMLKHFMQMAIVSPNPRSTYSGNCGILHATTA